MTTEPIILCNVRVYISGVTKFLTLSQSGGFDSVKNFVTHFVTLERWILIKTCSASLRWLLSTITMCPLLSSNEYPNDMGRQDKSHKLVLEWGYTPLEITSIITNPLKLT